MLADSCDHRGRARPSVREYGSKAAAMKAAAKKTVPKKAVPKKAVTKKQAARRKPKQVEKPNRYKHPRIGTFPRSMAGVG